jgi:hypothetical protein
MKKIVFIFLCFLSSNILFGDNLTIKINNNNRPVYNDGNLRLVIYYIPFSIDHRAALDKEQVKNLYRLKIEIRGETEIYNFIETIKNTRHKIIDKNIGDIRSVIEIFYGDTIIFSYCLTRFNVIIDGYNITNDMRFYRILLRYLPKMYEYDVGFIN